MRYLLAQLRSGSKPMACRDVGRSLWHPGHALLLKLSFFLKKTTNASSSTCGVLHKTFKISFFLLIHFSCSSGFAEFCCLFSWSWSNTVVCLWVLNILLKDCARGSRASWNDKLLSSLSLCTGPFSHLFTTTQPPLYVLSSYQFSVASLTGLSAPPACRPQNASFPR